MPMNSSTSSPLSCHNHIRLLKFQLTQMTCKVKSKRKSKETTPSGLVICTGSKEPKSKIDYNCKVNISLLIVLMIVCRV